MNMMTINISRQIRRDVWVKMGATPINISNKIKLWNNCFNKQNNNLNWKNSSFKILTMLINKKKYKNNKIIVKHKKKIFNIVIWLKILKYEQKK